MTRINCAVYVRKSTEKGLELEFNSLHNQEEACRSYILSQAFNNWEYFKTYTDGGISGGTMERPALKQMLEDIRHGLIQTVVVYKVDRLSRSIMDFHNMMKEFDKYGCSFVSITQAFDTSTSMGKLTLNMLLSFAQFEREVSSERVRDKICASKAKGLWTGGIPVRIAGIPTAGRAALGFPRGRGKCPNAGVRAGSSTRRYKKLWASFCFCALEAREYASAVGGGVLRSFFFDAPKKNEPKRRGRKAGKELGLWPQTAFPEKGDIENGIFQTFKIGRLYSIPKPQNDFSRGGRCKNGIYKSPRY